MSKINEIVIYIHGVSNEPRGRSHDSEYQSLHRGIAKNLSTWPSEYLGIEWGWNYKNVPKPQSQELLTDAQRLLGARAIQAVDAPWDFTINPGRLFLGDLRKLVIYGFADMFYYVSKDGKKAVRNTAATQVIDYLTPILNDENPNISLTLLGHSAGSVVAFDFLFYLFYTSTHNFLLDASTKKEKDLQTEFSKLRDLAQKDKLRIRRLITFGSPITSLACRSDSILEILAANDKLNPVHYGLDRNPPNFGEQLKGPRWINIWDKDDPIAWPVEPIMKQAPSVEVLKDIYIDVSDSISDSHNEYWKSDDVQKTIANMW